MLQEFRKSLGLTQEEFCEWLGEKGILGRDGKPYSAKTVQAWEQGLRNTPTKVVNTISGAKPLEVQLSEIIERLKNEKTRLSDYTTKELLAEIERRCGK